MATWLGRWPGALAVCGLFAAALFLPRLDGGGLWEPQERQLADRVAPPRSAASGEKPLSRPVDLRDGQAAREPCLRVAPPDAVARSLTARAIAWGRDTLGDSDAGRRLPLALLGVITVLAAAGTTLRLAGPRAAVLAAIALLAMPLCALQSRMLTSEIGTACGGALIVYGLVALGTLRGARARIAADAALAVVAVTAGVVLGFAGGGALLGLLAPFGAIAAAGAFGVPLIGALRGRAPAGPALVALCATLAALGLAALLAYQIYDLKPPYPGMMPPARALLGKAIVPGGCYASALGGIWRPEDDLRMTFDSTLEQIAYGTFPWGVLAPLAMAALLAAPDARRRQLGAVALGWAAAAWVAAEVFERKVGFTLYAGFPALALAIGAWLDGMLDGRTRRVPDAMPPGARLLAIAAVLAVLDLGKDLQSFAERLSSLLVGGDAVPYPSQARWLWLPTRLWVLILGAAVAISFALALVLWPGGQTPGDRERKRQRQATRSAIAAIAATIALAAFWPAIWQPGIATHLSSKAMFETYQALARPGDALVVMGDLGQAPFAYTARPPEIAADRTQILAALARPGRVFAIAPQSELCTLHREIGGKPYFVIDDRNTRSLLLSNRVDGASDKNPLRTAIVHQEPRDIAARPKGKIVWDNRIQLLGWDLPRSVPRGARLDITLYYKILQPVGGNWKSFMHFDGAAGRAGNGDHDPIAGRCPTSTWQPGDYIIDHFTAIAGSPAFPGGVHDVWIGFFTGAAPNWRNMTISEAPGDMRDTVDRVKIATIGLE